MVAKISNLNSDINDLCFNKLTSPNELVREITIPSSVIPISEILPPVSISSPKSSSINDDFFLPVLDFVVDCLIFNDSLLSVIS